LAAVWDTTLTNTDQKLFSGDAVTPLAEPASYSLQQVGAGTVTDTSVRDFLVGNRDTGVAPHVGSIALVALWDRVMSLDELISQQFRPRVSDGCALFSLLGYNGTGTQPDWSGNGNVGTVTGATVADHAPIPFRRVGSLYVPYTVAAGGDAVPQCWASYRRRRAA
jgi:hypothetical protein